MVGKPICTAAKGMSDSSLSRAGCFLPISGFPKGSPEFRKTASAAM
jgi:hypothetical protein